MSFLQHARRQGRSFQNPIPTTVALPGTRWATLRDLFVGGEERVPRKQLGPFSTDAGLYAVPPATGLRVTWMGHSTLLIEVDGKRILTDPVWATYASPVQALFAKRFFPPPLPLERLPRLDGVLLSHDHYDHLDASAIKRLAATDVPFICSLGMGRHLRRWGVPADRITELDWTDRASLGELTITAVPARHFSGRFRPDNSTLWSAFVIRTPHHNLFFGGDSGPFIEGFREIGEVYGPFDLTMLEIGAYGAYWPQIHMGPKHAAEAHHALRGRVMLPIHWGLFNLAYHSWREPVEWIIREAEAEGITLFLPRPGHPTDVDGGEHRSDWWVE